MGTELYRMFDFIIGCRVIHVTVSSCKIRNAPLRLLLWRESISNECNFRPLPPRPVTMAACQSEWKAPELEGNSGATWQIRHDDWWKAEQSPPIGAAQGPTWHKHLKNATHKTLLLPVASSLTDQLSLGASECTGASEGQNSIKLKWLRNIWSNVLSQERC